MVRGRVPRRRGLETLEEEHLVGGIQQPEDVAEPLLVGEEAAHRVLHLERLATLAPLADGDGVREDHDERRQLRPVLETGLHLHFHLPAGLGTLALPGLHLLHLVVAPEHEHHERGGRMGALEQFRHGGLARLVVAVMFKRGGEERETHLRQRREEVLLRLLLVLRHEERHEAGHLARGQVACGVKVARVRPEVGTGLRRDGVVELQLGEAGGNARVERVVDLARALEGEGEAVGDLRAAVVAELLELARPHELAHGREDALRIPHLLERREPAVAVRLGRGLEHQRLRPARGDIHELVAAQIRPCAFPEGLPFTLVGLDVFRLRLHETVLHAELLKARDRHVAETSKHGLHELAGLVLNHLLHAIGIGLGRDEDVPLGSEHEGLARRVERELVAVARAEVDRDAAVEGVQTLDLAQAPGGVEHKRPRMERHQPAKAVDRVLERTHAEPN